MLRAEGAELHSAVACCGGWLGESCVKVTRPGFEPGLRESKSLVLPLHHRAIRQSFDCANTLRILRPINNRE